PPRRGRVLVGHGAARVRAPGRLPAARRRAARHAPARARRQGLVLWRAGPAPRAIRLRALRVDARVVLLALTEQLPEACGPAGRVRRDGPGEVQEARRDPHGSSAQPPGAEPLMPGWLLWTLVGLGAWCAASMGFALLVGRLLGRRRPAVPA